MNKSMEILIPNTPQGLSFAAEDLSLRLARSGVDTRALHAMDVVLEELVSNAIRHGGLDDRCPQTHVRVTIFADHLVLEIVDHGSSFDPTVGATRKAGRDLPSEPIGGLGLTMVRHSVRHLEWSRVGQTNHVRAIINRNGVCKTNH